jgi:hypothetical protein
MDANEKPRKVSQVYVAKPVAKPEPLAAPELRVRSVIAPGSTRGHDTNNGGFEQTVAQPPHISATTPGESNNGGYETRVVQNG